MKIIKKLISIFIGLMSISSIIIFKKKKNPTLKIIFFIETIIFGLITYLLIKSKRKNKKVNIVTSNMPKENLNNIKGTFSQYEINNLLRIIEESYKIMQNTNDIKTLCERYELAMSKIYTLKELELTNEYKGNPNADYYISLFTSNYYQLIKRCHDKFLKKVKTKKEKIIEEDNFWKVLSEYVDEYTLQDIKNLN